MNNAGSNPRTTTRDAEPANYDSPMNDAESDDEIFEDVLPHHAETNEIPANVHDVRIDVGMGSPQTHDSGNLLLTPPESSIAPSVQTAPSVHRAAPLPQPRKHPLLPGGQKETSLIFYLDRALDNVGLKASNRNVVDLLPGEKPGYKSFIQVVKDLDPLIDIVWVSSTPTLQLPYLISITVAAINCITMFSPLPRTTLNFFVKLDTAFAALLSGTDPDTGETLPGFKNDRGISTTDKVRVKGIVERARATIVKHLVGEEGEEAPQVDRKADRAGNAEDDLVHFEGFDNSDDSEDEGEAYKRDERDVAYVFEKTIGELGDLLGGAPIGIVTDEEQDMRRQLEEDAEAMRERAAFAAEGQGVMEFDDEEEALAEQRRYMQDAKKEFEDEVENSGMSHDFEAHMHSAYAEKHKDER